MEMRKISLLDDLMLTVYFLEKNVSSHFSAFFETKSRVEHCAS